MPRIAPVDLNHPDPEVAAPLQAVKARLGRVPNLVATFARSPVTLAGYLQLSETLAGGRLSPRQRELVALAVAQENACEYCLSAHSAIARSLGLSPAEIEQARRGEAADAVDQAVARFAAQLVRRRGGVTDTELAAARSAGLDDGLLVEITAQVALNTLTNSLNRLAETDIDFPRVQLRPAA